MKIAIYGAGGILGQTMRLYQPQGIDVRYYRRESDPIHYGCDLTKGIPDDFLPDVILNFAGENRPDVVESQPDDRYRPINVQTPQLLAAWCDANGKHYIHVSTQGVFDGLNPPYSPDSELCPINKYGEQKVEAERRVLQYENWTILRPTFVLGIRPLPHIGRQNPIEQILTDFGSNQVNDRWFSPLFARMAARTIWNIVIQTPKQRVLHLGTPLRVSRYDLAHQVDMNPKPVSHSFFKGFAPRPLDTTYRKGCLASQWLTKGLHRCRRDWQRTDYQETVLDLAFYFGISEAEARNRLGQGFALLHQEVAADFRKRNPQTDDDLLRWYRDTYSYIWELSAYHLEAGFNYKGMCQGIIERLRDVHGPVLCLGDGVGHLTLWLCEAGIDAVYHDLQGSKTAAFAAFKFWRRTGSVPRMETTEHWGPQFNGQKYQVVLCLDFLEHVTDVPAWTRAIHDLIHPGGLALFQNAFNMGSGPDGSIPMHLKRNDRYEKDWTPLMKKTGFRQQGTSNWWEA